MGLKDLFVKSRGKGEESVGLTHKALKEWTQSLPLLDLPHCAVMLDAALFRLSMSEYKDQSWYDLLVILFEPIGSISRLACKKLPGDLSISRECQRALMFFIRRLHLQFADHSYNLLINNDELDNKSKNQAAFYALQSYSLVILRSYQLSMLTPKQVWLNFYDIYKILSIESSDSLVETLQDTKGLYDYKSPLSIFSSAVMLSLLSPYKLNANALEDIYINLNETLDHKIFYDGAALAQEEYCFAFGQDRAPSMFQFHPKNRENLIFINQKLALSKLKSSVNQGVKINKILLNNLASIETRQIERFNKSDKAQIVLGIANSYRLIYGKFDNLYETQTSDTQIFNYPDKKSKNWPIIIHAYKKATFPTNLSHSDEKPMNWEVIDQSLQGVGMISQESLPMASRSVGSFAQVKLQSNGRWLSALIRWINVKDGGLISLGLEYLARENIPVYLQSKNQRLKGYKSCAILGKYTFEPWPHIILITQGLSYHAGEELRLISEQNNLKIKLNTCLVMNKNCKIFSFKTEDALID